MQQATIPKPGLTADIVPFSFENKAVRTLQIDNEPWFVLKDVAKVLGMREHKNFLDSEWCDEKGVYSVPLLSSGGSQKTNIINEPNLYAMILRSNKPEALAFHRWVTSEVLPQIRKRGIYMAGEESPLSEGGAGFLKQLNSLEARVRELVADKQDALKDAMALPEPLGVLPELTHADYIHKAAQALCTLTGLRMDALWPLVYREISNRYHVRLGVRKNKQKWKGTTLTFAIQHGFADAIYSVLWDMLESARRTKLGR